MSERILRLPEVKARVGVGRSTLYDWMSRGTFPQPMKLGARLVGWRESDIAAWIEARTPKTGGCVMSPQRAASEAA